TTGLGGGDGRGLAAGGGVDGVRQVADLDGVGVVGVVHGAHVHQLACLVEHVEVRGYGGAQRLGDGLGFVIQVGEIETLLGGPFLHLGQLVGFAVVDVDGDDVSLGAEVLGELDNAIFVRHGDGAV